MVPGSVGRMRVGVDTGGTFTDLVTWTGELVKVPSTPEDPAEAIAIALGVSGAEVSVMAHGTTVATNALLERRGARVALVTNEGLTDVIEIARQDRPSLYDPFADRPAPLVARADRLGIAGRLAADGTELEPLGPVPPIPDGVEAVAVCLVHSDLEPAHEAAVVTQLRAAGWDASASHAVAPEMREYERTSTTVINAYLRPRCREYLRRLNPLAGDVLVMTSAAGLVPATDAAELPASLLLSGPAGGVLAAAEVAVANGFQHAISFDMGGTSTDVCLIQNGRPAPAGSRDVAGYPVRFPSLDIHTIGAGGGSIASIDTGGALTVGPESAGAVPGPACYGRGGEQPTVTDADLVAGRLDPTASFGGLRLVVDAARDALDGAGITASDVHRVVQATMAQALRAVSVERGVDPTGLALVAFGGAGPVHACDLADLLGMPAVIVPARAGVLSAVGILGAPHQRDLVRSWPTPADHRGLDDALAELAAAARSLVPGADAVALSVDCRYEGQSHELLVPEVGAFAAEHERRNGYARPGAAIEVVALRASARAASPPPELPPPPTIAGRVGPAVIPTPDCTIWVPHGWRADPGHAGALVLTRSGRPET